MKIYTKSGDRGETGMLGGVRVPKTHLAIEVCGCLDETNSLLGLAISQLSGTGSCSTISESVVTTLSQIQNDLFDVGSCVAASESETSRPSELSRNRSQQLEQWIDGLEQELPALDAFILPGGSPAAATVHLARSVCRRTERRLVALMESGGCRDFSCELIYLNRLGDGLFVLARRMNLAAGVAETKWSATH